MFEIKAGNKVEIMEHGNWIGPFKVTSISGETPEHIVLEGPSGIFQHYADEYNTRLVGDEFPRCTVTFRYAGGQLPEDISVHENVPYQVAKNLVAYNFENLQLSSITIEF